MEYRYLVECLRLMFYLPLVGGFRAPKAAQLPFASQAIRQSVIDWLFGALVRSAARDKMKLEVKSRAGSGNEETEFPFLKTEQCDEIDVKLLRVPLAPGTKWASATVVRDDGACERSIIARP